jgi:hypothetical protein
MSDWTKFVTNFYNEKKKTDPSYKFKNALQEAASKYKSSKSNGGVPNMNKTSKRKSSKRKSNKRKSRSSKR